MSTSDGAVLLHTKTRKFWELNQTADFILSRIIEGKSQATIAGALVSRSTVNPRQAADDIARLLSGLAAEGLIQS
ncbi:PqqD family peptide modification chaperone [Streptomyces sp. NBC_01167]|uniref:PqqD family peptide modification chaperone n=1 Tax=Streptomyces sp. NBC_01167 TaxID=2903756 RepID=UPI0038638151